MGIEELTSEEKAILHQTTEGHHEEPEQEAQQEVESEPVDTEPLSNAVDDVEPTQTEEQPAQAAPQPDPSKPPEGFVPHQAMHAEREKRKELEKRLAELEKASEPAPEAPPQYVDPIIDPDGYRKWAEFNNSQHSDAIQQFQKQQAEQQKQMERSMKLQNDVQTFMQKEPAYTEAYNWAIGQQTQALQSQGYLPEQIHAQLERDAQNLIDAAEMLNMTAPELLFMRAQQSGWQRQGQAAQQQVDETKRVEALANAQAATQGINSAGAPQKGKLTFKQLAEMSEEQLDKIPAAEKRALMGG